MTCGVPTPNHHALDYGTASGRCKPNTGGHLVTFVSDATAVRLFVVFCPSLLFPDTRPTSPYADPASPGARRGSRWTTSLSVTGRAPPGKQGSNSGLPLSRRTPYYWTNEAALTVGSSSTALSPSSLLHQGPYAPQGSTSLLPKLSVTSKVNARTSYAWVGSQVHFRSSEDVTLLEFTSPVDREYKRRRRKFH